MAFINEVNAGYYCPGGRLKDGELECSLRVDESIKGFLFDNGNYNWREYSIARRYWIGQTDEASRESQC